MLLKKRLNMLLRNIRNSPLLRSISRVTTSLAAYTCSPKKRSFLIFMGLIVFTASVLSIFDTRLVKEEILSMKLAQMQNEMEFLKSSYRNKLEEIINVQMRLEAAADSLTPNSHNDNTTTFPQNVAALMKNLNETRVAAGLRPQRIWGAPFVNQLLPHTMSSQRSLYPAFHMKSSRKSTEYVIGVPTIKRDKENYLLITLEHLLAGISAEYENSSLIVVCVGETNLEYVVQVAQEVAAKFPKHVDSGLIEVISPTPGFYPDILKEKPNLGDSVRRFRWRSKQNLDAIFLMAYAQTRGIYYLMLEDDVISNLDYMDVIKAYTTKVSVSQPNWIFIDFGKTGGIGKLFKSAKLKYFVMYVELFYRSMPIDWLLEKYLENCECPIDASPKQCQKIKDTIRPRYSTALFQHIGLYSSLKGKINKVKDHKYINELKFFPHINPPLQYANTSIQIYSTHVLMDAYLGLNFFWGIKPKKGDTVEFIFKEPLYIKSFLFRSGNLDHIYDIFRKTMVEVVPIREDQKTTIVGSFDEFGLAEGTVEEDIGPVQSIRLRVTMNHTNWVILSEIYITKNKNLTTDLLMTSVATLDDKKSSVIEKN